MKEYARKGSKMSKNHLSINRYRYLSDNAEWLYDLIKRAIEDRIDDEWLKEARRAIAEIEG